MKDNVYINQFFYDGFGRYLFLTPVRYLRDNIKNKIVVKILTILLAIFYSILMFCLAKAIFDLNYPF